MTCRFGGDYRTSSNPDTQIWAQNASKYPLLARSCPPETQIWVSRHNIAGLHADRQVWRRLQNAQQPGYPNLGTKRLEIPTFSPIMPARDPNLGFSHNIAGLHADRQVWRRLQNAQQPGYPNLGTKRLDSVQFTR